MNAVCVVVVALLMVHVTVRVIQKIVLANVVVMIRMIFLQQINAVHVKEQSHLVMVML
jgi:hypothetical protein